MAERIVRISRKSFQFNPEIFHATVTPIAHAVARRMASLLPHDDPDDLAAAAIAEIWRKRRRYRTRRGASVETWVTMLCIRSMYDRARSLGRTSKLMRRLHRELSARGMCPET